MKKKKVIGWKYLPTRLRLFNYATTYLLLKHFNASPIVWGIVGTLAVLFFITTLVSLGVQKKVHPRDL